MQTGISGNTLRYTFAPFTTFNFRFTSSSTVCSCFPVSLAPFPRIRMPHSPNASVVPLVEPPIGIGMTPLCRLTHVTLRGASWERCRAKIGLGGCASASDGERDGERDGAALRSAVGRCRRRAASDELRENMAVWDNDRFCLWSDVHHHHIGSLQPERVLLSVSYSLYKYINKSLNLIEMIDSSGGVRYCMMQQWIARAPCLFLQQPQQRRKDELK